MKQKSYSLNISELHDQYREGFLTLETLISDIRIKIESYKNYNIWIYILSDNELQTYISNLHDKGPDDLPLYGIPFAIKDNIDLAGIPTTAACPDYSYIPKHSAYVVQRLIDAGAIPIGKTNLDQFATGLVGTRSPYGAVKNSFNSDYISGGSSSGSAVSVALDQVSFSLGTDTAGSGRVPAAFNNLIGLKPTKGRLSTSGIVPACRSLDCVSLFSLNPDDTTTVFEVMDQYDPNDDYSRSVSAVPTTSCKKIGVPKKFDLEYFGNNEYQKLFDEFLKKVCKQSYEIIEIDFSPFKEAANLLYQGSWLAERYAAIENFLEMNPDSLFPVTKGIIEPAKKLDAVDCFKGFYHLQALKKKADKILEQVEFILTPTVGTIYTIDEVNNEPIKTNSNLGYYTNFMNLLDYSAIAIPAGFDENNLPFGVTLFSQAFEDKTLLKHSRCILGNKLKKMGATEFNWSSKKS